MRTVLNGSRHPKLFSNLWTENMNYIHISTAQSHQRKSRYIKESNSSVNRLLTHLDMIQNSISINICMKASFGQMKLEMRIISKKKGR